MYDYADLAPRYYRLPNGDITRSQKQYFEAWEALIDKVEAFFPGYKVVAYDPGLRLSKTKVNDQGFAVEVGSISLSVDAVETLTAPKNDA